MTLNAFKAVREASKRSRLATFVRVDDPRGANGKRYAVREDLRAETQISTAGLSLQFDGTAGPTSGLRDSSLRADKQAA